MSHAETPTDAAIDAHLEAILRAAGSSLRYYTLPRTIPDMRAALRSAVAALSLPEAPIGWHRPVRMNEGDWDSQVIMGATHPNDLGMPAVAGPDWEPLYSGPQPSAAPVVPQWLPIETAPADMTECVAVRWVNSEGEECRELDYTEDGCWMGWHDHAEHTEIIGGHGVSYTPPYTGWMPLPPAPQQGEQG